MDDQAQHVPNGLKTARNVLAAIGVVALVLTIVMAAAGSTAVAVPLWGGMACLVVALGLALATTRWRALPVGTRVVILVVVALLGLVLVDLL